jgi:hypothetical protein
MMKLCSVRKLKTSGMKPEMKAMVRRHAKPRLVLVQTTLGFDLNHAWFWFKPRLVLTQTTHGFGSNHAWF